MDNNAAAAASNAKQRMISATMGAAITSFLMTPLDVVKVRLQATTATPALLCCSDVFFCGPNAAAQVAEKRYQDVVACRWNHPRPNPPGTLECIRNIVKFEGPTALWRGLSPTLMLSVPATVVYFAGYDELKKVFSSSPLAPLLAGASARTLAATFISPLELIRTRVQAAQGKKAHLSMAIKDLIHQVRIKGVEELYRGLGPTLWRDVPFSAIYWTCYEFIKSRLSNKARDLPQEFQVAFFAGATSGMVAATITLPFDVVKTRMQTAGKDAQQGMLQVFRTIWEREGWRGLTTGLTPRVVKVAPACAIMISSYEVGKRFFN